MTVLAVHTPETGAARYTLRIAGDAGEVAAAQRLRHRVFAEELGATLHTPVPRLHIDEVDEYCDHLTLVAEARAQVDRPARALPPRREPNPDARSARDPA